MTNFNFYDYQKLPDNQVLKMKVKGLEDFIFVHRVSRSVLQPYQPAHTPISKINLEVIKDIDIYKQDKHHHENRYELTVEPEEVEQFELIEF